MNLSGTVGFFGLLLLASLEWMALAQPAPSSPDWPQWRGPTRDGQVKGNPWPGNLRETTLRPLWRKELGPSYSGPIVGGGRIYVTETVEAKTERVRALAWEDGRELWQASWEGALSVPFFAKSNGDWIRSTPSYDGERLYVGGMRDVLVCLIAATGAELWRVDFPAALQSPLPGFGLVCSPLVEGEFVFVQAGAAVVKLAKRTGKVLWRVLSDGGGMWGSAFSSPVLAELAGRRQLLVQTREKLAGLDPEDGKELWSQAIPAFRGMNILTPMVAGDIVFTSTYGGKTAGYRVTARDGAVRVESVWTHKAQGYMSTPVVVQGVAYHHLRSQRLMAINVADGAERWTSGESYGKYWSMVAQADRILGLDERGWLYLLAAAPDQCRILDSRKVSEVETWAHLAVSGDRLLIRELRAIAAWQWSDQGRL